MGVAWLLDRGRVLHATSKIQGRKWTGFSIMPSFVFCHEENEVVVASTT
jgi:hypothetical protein